MQRKAHQGVSFSLRASSWTVAASAALCSRLEPICSQSAASKFMMLIERHM